MVLAKKSMLLFNPIIIADLLSHELILLTHSGVCTVFTTSVCPVYTLTTLDFGLGTLPCEKCRVPAIAVSNNNIFHIV